MMGPAACVDSDVAQTGNSQFILCVKQHTRALEKWERRNRYHLHVPDASGVARAKPPGAPPQQSTQRGPS